MVEHDYVILFGTKIRHPARTIKSSHVPVAIGVQTSFKTVFLEEPAVLYERDGGAAERAEARNEFDLLEGHGCIYARSKA